MLGMHRRRGSCAQTYFKLLNYTRRGGSSKNEQPIIDRYRGGVSESHHHPQERQLWFPFGNTAAIAHGWIPEYFARLAIIGGVADSAPANRWLGGCQQARSGDRASSAGQLLGEV